MDTNKPQKRKIEIVNQDEEVKKGYVVLPYSEKDFKDFITGLLGKPQTLEGRFSATYNFEKGDIINIHHLVEQRVLQNDSTLISIHIQIVYNDDSSIIINSIESFRTYNELRPIIPIAIHLSWTYLIKFTASNFPEKQVINISIGFPGIASYGKFRIKRLRYEYYKTENSNAIYYSIETTDRTWGVDIENLLRNHFFSCIIKPSKFKQFFRNLNFDGYTTLFFVILSLMSSYFGSRFLQNQILTSYRELIAENAYDISLKIDWIFENISSGVWSVYLLGVMAFIITSIFVSIPIGNYLEALIDKEVPSYLLFTSAAQSFKKQNDKREKIHWRNFFATLIFGVIVSLIANILFAKFFYKLL